VADHKKAFRKAVKEIVTDCVITGYENAGELIKEKTDAVLAEARKLVPARAERGGGYMIDFEAYSIGIVCASVCSRLSKEDTKERMNRENPTGLEHGWDFCKDKTFKTGQPNPCPCEDEPETHKHYLFNC